MIVYRENIKTPDKNTINYDCNKYGRNKGFYFFLIYRETIELSRWNSKWNLKYLCKYNVNMKYLKCF